MEKSRKRYRTKENKSNKKERLEETLVVKDILKEETVAFLDTEFLTSQKKGGPPAKLVSIGFVICRDNFREIERFHSYIYLEDKLHDRFKEVTGITEKKLRNAPDYEMVMEEAMELLELWNVSKIFVWGPDELVIRRDLEYHRQYISKKLRKTINRSLRMMKDIEGIYSGKLSIRNISISNLKLLCGLEAEVSHDALDDAIDLKRVIKVVDTKGCPKQMVKAMKRYLADKEAYCRSRRFREPWIESNERLKEKGAELLAELEKIGTMEALALRDDILVASTGKEILFPSPEEYIETLLNSGKN